MLTSFQGRCGGFKQPDKRREAVWLLWFSTLARGKIARKGYPAVVVKSVLKRRTATEAAPWHVEKSESSFSAPCEVVPLQKPVILYRSGIYDEFPGFGTLADRSLRHGHYFPVLRRSRHYRCLCGGDSVCHQHEGRRTFDALIRVDSRNISPEAGV